VARCEGVALLRGALAILFTSGGIVWRSFFLWAVTMQACVVCGRASRMARRALVLCRREGDARVGMEVREPRRGKRRIRNAGAAAPAWKGSLAGFGSWGGRAACEEAGWLQEGRAEPGRYAESNRLAEQDLSFYRGMCTTGSVIHVKVQQTAH